MVSSTIFKSPWFIIILFLMVQYVLCFYGFIKSPLRKIWFNHHGDPTCLSQAQKVQHQSLMRSVHLGVFGEERRFHNCNFHRNCWVYDIIYMAVCQNLVPLVNIKIACKWMFIPLKMVLIGIDPYPYNYVHLSIYIYIWNILLPIGGFNPPEKY